MRVEDPDYDVDLYLAATLPDMIDGAATGHWRRQRADAAPV